MEWPPHRTWDTVRSFLASTRGQADERACGRLTRGGRGRWSRDPEKGSDGTAGRARPSTARLPAPLRAPPRSSMSSSCRTSSHSSTTCRRRTPAAAPLQRRLLPDTSARGRGFHGRRRCLLLDYSSEAPLGAGDDGTRQPQGRVGAEPRREPTVWWPARRRGSGRRRARHRRGRSRRRHGRGGAGPRRPPRRGEEAGSGGPNAEEGRRGRIRAGP
ncbi:hypothetical protein BS78_08G087600 [Paspalum vaginatum]|uniref:Uncharacterized protein n=1 Tax=Paspalum vaginatum TaxID=158149 RepID=A0A9W7X9D9_9POAL|nr:hypothetical protein BS78_K304900 [Paspalum vaginatum]KAJ1265590.1 hypothetical protein BS78_08G087600 [Paspalum vaginatum]